MQNKTLILIGFILIKFFLQFTLISPEYELHRDEFLHLDQANYPAWGYYSVPPFISWISMVIKLLGNSVFWVKFFPALFGALTILVVWKTVEELKGSLFALCLAATCVLFSVLLRLNTLYQPNSFDVLCWTSFYFCVVKYINTENAKWLFYGAIVAALGFLNKYNVVFMLAGLFPAVLLTPQRKVLANSKFYVSLGLAFLLILPNLIWQYTQNFPVISHMKELAETQLVNVNTGEFLISQLLFFLGGIHLIILSLIAFWKYEPYSKYRSFFWTFIFTLAIFMYFKAKDYYAIGLYPIYIAFGAVYMDSLLKSKIAYFIRSQVVLFPIVAFIPMYLYVFPNRSPDYIIRNEMKYKSIGMLRWEDGKDHQLPQDFADILGWKELAAKVDQAYASFPVSQNTMILCDNYGQAGAINFYSKRNLKAVSFNADYVNWIRTDRKYDNLIRVKEADDNENEMKETSPYFNAALKKDSVENKFAREYRTAVYVFSGAKTDINIRIKAEIDEITKLRNP